MSTCFHLFRSSHSSFPFPHAGWMAFTVSSSLEIKQCSDILRHFNTWNILHIKLNWIESRCFFFFPEQNKSPLHTLKLPSLNRHTSGPHWRRICICIGKDTKPGSENDGVRNLLFISNHLKCQLVGTTIPLEENIYTVYFVATTYADFNREGLKQKGCGPPFWQDRKTSTGQTKELPEVSPLMLNGLSSKLQWSVGHHY